MSISNLPFLFAAMLLGDFAKMLDQATSWGERLLEPPVFYWALGVFGLLIFWLLRRFFSLGSEVRQQLRDAKRAKDFVTVGEIYEDLGKPRAALAAYRRGGCHRERVALLERLGKRGQAKLEAYDAEIWDVYAEICERDKDFRAAGEAYELLGRSYEAARCFEAAGDPVLAARAYIKAGVEEPVFGLLAQSEGAEAADLLEKALRATWDGSPSAMPTQEQMSALARCIQMLIEAGEAQRAFQLAVETEQWELAVPVARDHLSPSNETAEACIRAGAPWVAAEIYDRLGEERLAALQRAEHYERAQDPAAAAAWFERAEAWDLAAEHWAASGDSLRAAELFERMGDLQQAANLYQQAGSTEKHQKLARRLADLSLDPSVSGEASFSELIPAAAAGLSISSGDERYELEEEIGRGGMGIVYRALDRTLERRVALKVLLGEMTQQEEAARELLAEARAIAKMSHPNIVQVYDAGYLRGNFFMAMEWVDGQNMAQVLEQKRLAIHGVIYIGKQICAALDHAHKQRIIHRDLKPSNLLWTQENTIKLTDFGLARALEISAGQVVTRPAGTPYYMAPEQICGQPLDGRTDLYALGCVLFEMLCRETPFPDHSPSIYHHLNTQPRDPRDVCVDAPEELAQLILSCLEKEPVNRPSSAAEVIRRLASLE